MLLLLPKVLPDPMWLRSCYTQVGARERDTNWPSYYMGAKQIQSNRPIQLPSPAILPCCYVGTLLQILAGIETLGGAHLTDILWSVACMEVAKPSPESQQNQGHQQQQQGQGKGEGQGGQQQGQDGREAGANGASGRLISYRPPDSWMKLLFQVWKV